MERDFKGIWIAKDIWLSDDLTLQEKVFLVEIDSLDNESGCYANNQYFADFFGISKTRVSIVINSLVNKGYITSQIIYKEGTKEILKRVLKICYRPYPTKVKDPIQGKFKDNNTINNTINNTVNKEYIPYSEIIDYLNKKADKKYKPSSDATKNKIKARWNEGFRLEDFKKVIDNKVAEWENSDMEKFLRPETLFGTKFESYLNQKEVQSGSTGQNTKTSKGKWTGFKPKQSNNELTAEDRKWAEENLI